MSKPGMSGERWRRGGAWWVRALLGGVLVWAGCVKLLDTRTLFLDLLAYDLPLSDGGLRFVAAVFPCVEVMVGLAVWWDGEGVGAWLALMVCAVFGVLLGQAALRGLRIDCGCFGHAAAPTRGTVGWALLRAMALLAMSGYLCFLSIRP